MDEPRVQTFNISPPILAHPPSGENERASRKGTAESFFQGRRGNVISFLAGNTLWLHSLVQGERWVPR